MGVVRARASEVVGKEVGKGKLSPNFNPLAHLHCQDGKIQADKTKNNFSHQTTHHLYLASAESFYSHK